MAGEEDNVSKAEFAMYVKGVNGDLEDIKISIATLTDGMNRRFDALDLKFELERKNGREAHQRIHEKIEGVNESLVVEMAGVGEEFSELKDGHWSKGTAAIVAVLSSSCVGLLIAFIMRL